MVGLRYNHSQDATQHLGGGTDIQTRVNNIVSQIQSNTEES